VWFKAGAGERKVDIDFKLEIARQDHAKAALLLDYPLLSTITI
jgi:hypothetical protein